MAIALVVLFHTESLVTGRSADVAVPVSLPGAFVLAGHTGVTLFFVLSGFLLAPPFVAEALGGRIVSRRTYFRRRARRILPAYYLFVALGSVTHAKTPADVLHGIPYLFFLQGLPDFVERLGPWSGVWWSLATEAQFYVLLPCLAFLGRNGAEGRGRPALRGRWGISLLLIVYAAGYAVVTWRGLEGWSLSGQLQLFGSVFGRGPAFAFGAIAALLVPRLRAFQEGRDSPALRIAAAGLVAALLLALALLLPQVVVAGFFAAELQWNWWHLLEALLWSAVVLLVVAVPFGAKALFCNRPMWALGRWSYSLYLIHFPVLWVAFARPIPYSRPLGFVEVGAAALVIAACVAASAVSYRFVERPFFAPPA